MRQAAVKRPDRLTPAQRSAHMAKVRATRNRSTEMRVAAYLIRHGVRGWQRHPSNVAGRPDFYFPAVRLAVFVDGCFWHGCRKCNRNMPSSRADFWLAKIDGNRQRDRKVNTKLRRGSVRVLRIWEHELAAGDWWARLLASLASGCP